MKTISLVACLLVFGVGCSTLNVQRPTAAVTGMSVQGVDATGFTMNFDVDVTNPNATALPLTAADYKVGLSGVNVVNGNAKPEGSIPANGTKRVALPVTMTYENLLLAEQAIVKSGGDVPYTLDAGLLFNPGTSLLGNLRVPLQYNGTLPLKQVLNNPQAIMQNPAAQKLAKELISNFSSYFGH